MMDEKILQLFSFLSKLEQSAQDRRKVLTDHYDYNPAKIFKKLDTENKGYLNIENIISFIDNHNIPYTDESVKLLIVFYDSDFDGILSFQEFLYLIQNDNILIKNKIKQNKNGINNININSNDNDISFNIEYCLGKIIEKELELNQYIVKILKQINNMTNDNILGIFNKISLNKKHILNKDIMNYLDINKIEYSTSQIYDIKKRLDIDKDRRINFSEFNYLFESVNTKINNDNINTEAHSLNNYIDI